MLYLILSKPTFQPVFLRAGSPEKPAPRKYQRVAGQLFFVGATIWGWLRVRENGQGTYTGLIVVWASPILLLQWLATQLEGNASLVLT
jgi:15-cis-phytoene synthase/lycopene beta-cyclase